MSSSNNNKEEEFSFIKEKIKEKPLNKKRILWKALMCVIMAIVFGTIASLTFVITKPYFDEKLNKNDEPDKVLIPKDETSADGTQAAATQTPDESVTQEPAQTIENNVVVPEFELELDDIGVLYNKLNQIAKDADKFIVTVTGVTSDVDWFNDTLVSQGQASGIIIANNGQEILLLTSLNVVDNVEKIMVTFSDGSTLEASEGKYDSNTNLAIVSVPLKNIEESTMNSIDVASLGNSYACSNGDFVISVGSPLGYNNSVTYGMLTSTSKTVTTTDANYRILTTDAAGSSSASGVLINLDGEVIGIISPEYNPDTSMGIITALAISDLKTGIEKLSNYEDVIYFGIKGSDVTSEIAEQQNLPVGVYVVETAMDSPAMNAGIQNGDVITKIGDEEIKTMREFQNELGKYQPDQTVSVVVKRQGIDQYKDIDFIVTLGAMN